MIFGKLWDAFKAQMNKLANAARGADPIAQMQYEYDNSVEQLKEGRLGLEQYRALVDRVSRQVEANRREVAQLEATIKALLQADQRAAAADKALALRKVRARLEEDLAQLQMHEEAYNNHLLKVKHASGKLAEVKDRIQRYDAEIKMSRAEAEIAKLAHDFNFEVTTDFGQIESVIQDKIGLNRAKARVAADLSGQGLEQIKQEQAVEKQLAEQALKEFEAELQSSSSAPPALETASSRPTPALEPPGS